MVEKKLGILIKRRRLAPKLSIFRIATTDGKQFPAYQAGKYIALRREDCLLTKKGTDPADRTSYVQARDEHGKLMRGPITHSYSISSAPFETLQKGYLEFYITLEVIGTLSGRLTESLFRMDPKKDNELTYVDRIVGNFTLEKRAAGYQNVLMVGTGTGLAPFASMIKQLDFEASQGETTSVRYTLLHANRTVNELAYHKQLSDIESAARFDFVYVPSVSRPTHQDLTDPTIGKGRANNLLRFIFEMPLKEEENLQQVALEERNSAGQARVLSKTVRPSLPQHTTRKDLQERLTPSQTVILSCGNPRSMADIQAIGEGHNIHFEKEDW